MAARRSALDYSVPIPRLPRLPLSLKQSASKAASPMMKTACTPLSALRSPAGVSQGETEEAALAKITDAIRECLAVRAEWGMPLTVETREIEVVV